MGAVPAFGEGTESILADLGYGRIEIDGLRADHVIRSHPATPEPPSKERQSMSTLDVLSEDEQFIVSTVHDFVDRDVKPVVQELEHANTYPEALIEHMKQLGVFGLAIPEEYGGTPVSVPCYVLVTEELARGWMSLAGAMGGHNVVAKLLLHFGTEEQKRRYLPRMATGEVRATMALTEPGGGSDLQAMHTVARQDADGYVVNGTKTWITNSRRSQLIALLCKTDTEASPAHQGISILLVEHGPGLTVSRDLPKLGYKGVESCELSFEDYRAPADAVLGGVEGKGFAQMMRGLETGRLQVAARALGVGRAAFEDALAYAQERESFGKPIWRHQSIGNYLAEMATSLTAARQLTLYAAREAEAGRRVDMEAGMAKLFASETAMQIALNAVRIHGGYGYSTEFDVERYFRDAPLMIVGEGTNEIQRNVIASQLVRRGGLDA
ncbi:isovaleryl-CoA dehydrogenase [Streptomyces albiflavescens]|uniref:Isovaleryl-CoA dehydrogenase n=2 Tax=Streptomyces albiflavescens TaxID=1623582 RepID=A0A918D7F9_9ACTN|nr:isovaleryl-CoA dehydrogenase [Streptomyces albiflavescens]